ncbi:DUF262 domain-containing protein [Paenibacillus yanchengensis]|uniref:DUF262 domain-containing protein n=1 Tax=Paenibacillus yanchengensis TaxID=2035833 RepID=A0ABW4YM32_9BACL
MSKGIHIIGADKLFLNVRYNVPIYQRNYAWKSKEIEALLDDLYGAFLAEKKDYFLGNLIVNQTENEQFDVIDGQQRLTTLYLLHSYLHMGISRDALRFEAREKSNRTLVMLNEHRSVNDLAEELVSSELNEGYKVIESYFKARHYSKEDYITQFKRVHLVRVQVPQGIDLNHYFEIMNTCGEQLELHEIAKAKFLEVLINDRDRHMYKIQVL